MYIYVLHENIKQKLNFDFEVGTGSAILENDI